MSQTERIAYLDRRLREAGWVTAAEVAERFEVSPRQVKRDIEYLRWRLDAPLVYEAAKRRYRYEKPFTRFRFADERRVLFSSLVRGWAASESHRPFVTPELLEGIEAAIPRDYRSVADRIRYEAPSSEPVDLEVFAGLCRGLRERRQVEIEYTALGGEGSRRRVEVQRLWNYAGVWYLIAFDHLRGGLRTFHLGRIAALTVTPEAVTKDEDDATWRSQLEAWLTAGSGLFRGGDAFDVTVRLRDSALRLAGSQRWHSDQRDEPGADADGAFIDRTLPAVDTRELVGRVLALGADAEPLAPPAFRDRWAEEVRRMAARFA